MGQQSLAFKGQSQVSTLPDKKMDTKLALKLFYPGRNGSGGHKQVLSSTGEMTRAVDLNKCFQQIDIHDRILPGGQAMLHFFYLASNLF
jgi:hypothetical protein